MDPLEPNQQPAVPGIAVPPKPPGEEPRSRANIWLRAITSLALYLAIGYYFFNQNWTWVLILTAVVIFHELGHFFAMKAYNYTDLGIFFIPLVGAYASGKKHEVSQLQSSIILLAGPVPGIIVGVLLQLLIPYFTDNPELARLMENVSIALVFLNLLNLLPIYPLDGGQLLNRLFLDNSQVITKIFLALSIGLMVWFALFSAPKPFGYILLIIPVFLLSRMFTDAQYDRLSRKVESEGIDLTIAYEDISNEDYWKIRNIIIRNQPSLKDVPLAPPYEYSEKEDQIMTLMQNLLQRNIVQDMSIPAKILIIVIWIACFIVPFLFTIPLRP